MPAGFEDPAPTEVAVDPELPADLRTAGRLGDCDGGVRRLKRLLLRGERRIRLIGRHERIAQRIGARRAGHQGSNQRSGYELAKHFTDPLKP
jgi:hypothetical protein